MKKKIFRAFCLLFLVCLTFNGCKKKNTPVDVAVPKMSKEQVEASKNVEVEILRYEQDLFNIDQKNMSAAFAAMYGKYPDNLIAKGAWNNVEMIESIRDFINDPVIKELYKDSEAKFGDMSDFENTVKPALMLYCSHFPDNQVPNFCTLVSGMDFNMPSVFGYVNTIFICLDMYLGKDYKKYASSGMPRYIAARCEKKYMATDCFSNVLAYKHLPDITLVTLLDNMIDAGKKLFFTQVMFPSVPQNDILHYSDEQYKWAKSHESAVWHYMIEKNLIYNNNDEVIGRMIDETPFTRDFGNSSPGRIGCYIGLQIVQSYMESHPGTTLKELMKMTDSQKFLKESGYKPK